MFKYAALTALSLAAFIHSVASISTITTVGSKFFTSDGDQFYIKGVAYQLSPDDPLIDTDQCQLDAKLMKELGANAIRVYHVDADGDHKGCMDAFSQAGVYLFLDLDTFTTQIEPDTPHWNSTQYERFTGVLDAFHQFDNLAGVFVGNEVLTKPVNAPAAPYVKAAARDIKAYRDSKNYRKIPVGYSAADIAELRPMLQNYLVCGGNSSETIDFYGLNAYEWCGPSDFKTSGYSALETQSEGFPVPIFFSETGCNTSPPRTFQDQAAILGSDMDDTWSGAIVYEWIEEANHYGLVNYGGAAASGAETGFARAGTPVPVSPDFTNLKSQWATLKPTGVQLSAYSASASKLSTPECPQSTASGWTSNGNPALPAIDQKFEPTATGAKDSSATGTAAAASASSTNGSPTGGKEIAGMSLGLASVMVGFIVWL